MKKGWKIFAALWMATGGLFLSAACLDAAVRPEQFEKDISAKKKDLKEIRKELFLAKEKEKQIQGRESSVLDSLHRMETELYRKEKELKQMEDRLGLTKKKLYQAQDQITALNRGMSQTKDELSSRLIALYKMGRNPPGFLLLTSDSYSNLLRADKYLRVIIDYDAGLLETFRSQVGMKEKYHRQLVQDRTQWERAIFGGGEEEGGDRAGQNGETGPA